MNRLKLSFLFLLSLSLLFSQSGELDVFFNKLLENSPDYLQAVNRFERAKAVQKIDKSLNWFDLNFIYKHYGNDFTRDDKDILREYSEVFEKDTRKRIEIERRLFLKDFDDASDLISSQLELYRYQQDLFLDKYNLVSKLFEDLILWQEAVSMNELISEKLLLLNEQYLLLGELDQENLIETRIIINTIEDIDDSEKRLNKYAAISEQMFRKYGNILNEFSSLMTTYQYIETDTIIFVERVNKHRALVEGNKDKISTRIKWKYLQAFLPEVRFTLSYNWRDTEQNWESQKGGNNTSMTRIQKERFPEGELRLTIPFNFIDNTKGKTSLLKTYERELQFRTGNILSEWDDFEITRLTNYRKSEQELRRKTQLAELYQRELNLQTIKYREEPTLLGTNPELILKQVSLKAIEAEIKRKSAQLRFYKEAYILYSFCEEKK